MFSVSKILEIIFKIKGIEVVDKVKLKVKVKVRSLFRKISSKRSLKLINRIFGFNWL